MKFLKFNLWLNNSHGKPSASLTFYAASFAVVCLAIIVSLVKHIEVNGVKIDFAVPDTNLLLGFFAIAGSGYVYRRTKDDGMAHKERLAALRYPKDDQKA